MLILCLLSMLIQPAKIRTPKDVYGVQPVKLSEIMPDTSSNPEDSTIVFMGYTQKEIVFYFKNYQKGKVSATIKKRDAEAISEGEDAIFIILAPNGKGRNAYYIAVNPLGTVYDKMLTPQGLVEWDGDIRTTANITNYGWECMVEIPFSTINYSEDIWGIQILRNIISKSEMMALYPTDNIGSLYDMADLKIDFNYIEKRKNISSFVIPSFRVERIYDSAKSQWTNRIKIGGTSRLKQGNNTVMDATVLPDYSELPLDFKRFSLNRLPISYPEKRPFFIEGRGYYKLPKLLIRTRNMENIEYGGKFYTATKNSDFIVYHIKDTVLGNVTFSRFKYHFSSLTDIGFFTLLDNVNYDLVSFDAAHTVKKYGLDIIGQWTSVINAHSQLKYFKINRSANMGLTGSFSFSDIDTGFISPLNAIEYNFEGIRRYTLNTQYLRYFQIKNKNLVLSVSGYGLHMKNKITGSLVQNTYSGNLTTYMVPYGIALLIEKGQLNYLPLQDNSYKLAGGGILYYISSWKQARLMLIYGDYLGGHLFNPELVANISPFGLNTGIDVFFVKSPFDSMYTVNFYGEYPTPLKHLLIKPSLTFTDNLMANEKSLDMNIVFLYEPDYIKGIYLAYQKTMFKTGTNNWSLSAGKIIFKINWGFKIL